MKRKQALKNKPKRSNEDKSQESGEDSGNSDESSGYDEVTDEKRSKPNVASCTEEVVIVSNDDCSESVKTDQVDNIEVSPDTKEVPTEDTIGDKTELSEVATVAERPLPKVNEHVE